MTTTEPLAEYTNGNVSVWVSSDGTKTRRYSGVAEPSFPESIDLKITNWCDAGCRYCHENSVRSGKHADPLTIYGMLENLPPGVEIAIGGGDPLSHPRITEILQWIRERGLIGNVTINGVHAKRHSALVRSLRSDGLLYGLGVSFRPPFSDFERFASEVYDENTVIHVIAGENPPQDAIRILHKFPKILILGYKNYGRGVFGNAQRVDHVLAAWRYWVRTILGRGVVCFDNLAIDQLDIRGILPSWIWKKHYMGGDGQFTMYADAVDGKFAKSSTSPRAEWNHRPAREFFAGMVKGEK